MKDFPEITFKFDGENNYHVTLNEKLILDINELHCSTGDFDTIFETGLEAGFEIAQTRGEDLGCGFSSGEVDSGELEIKMSVRGHEGSTWLSKEMWEAIGEKMGWITT